MTTSGKYSEQYKTVPAFSFHEEEPGEEFRNMGNPSICEQCQLYDKHKTGNVRFNCV